MQFQYHANLTLTALRRWLIAQCYDSLMVSALWFAALTWLKVPWAPFWALLAGALQFIPHFGPLLTLLGPAMAMLVTSAPWQRWFWLLGAYAVIAIVDGLVLQPYLMHRQNRVPFWASLLTPIVLGIVVPVLGSLLAPRPARRYLCSPWCSKAAGAHPRATVFQPRRGNHSAPGGSSRRRRIVSRQGRL